MTTKEFIKGLTKESEDFKKISTFKKPEEAYEFFKSKGVSDTYEEYVNTMKDYAKKVEGLSEKELEGVAGGNNPTIPVSSALTTLTVNTTTATGNTIISI